MPRHEVVQVRHLGEDVVADDQVGRPALRDELAAAVSAAEELDERRDAALDRRRGDVGGRLDAEDGNAPRDEVLEEVAVVARELDDAGARAEAESRSAIISA